jgi:hypothetical protein
MVVPPTGDCHRTFAAHVVWPEAGGVVWPEAGGVVWPEAGGVVWPEAGGFNETTAAQE